MGVIDGGHGLPGVSVRDGRSYLKENRKGMYNDTWSSTCDGRFRVDIRDLVPT